MKWKKALQQTDYAVWELSYRTVVIEERQVSIDEWLLTWLWERLAWPDGRHSLFKSGNVLLDASIFEVRVLVEVGHGGKRRYVRVRLYENNPYHPNFDEWLEVSEIEWRFPSFGNPYLDQENYSYWEQMLFCKLMNQALEEKKGLDFLIERSRRVIE